MPERQLKDCEIVKAGDLIEWKKNCWTTILHGSPMVGKTVMQIYNEEGRITRVRRDQPAVYVFTMFVDMFPVRGWACDREYTYLDWVSWKDVKMGDIIEIDKGDTIGLNGAYYDAPVWAEQLIESGHKYVTMWTNYYEGGK